MLTPHLLTPPLNKSERKSFTDLFPSDDDGMDYSEVVTILEHSISKNKEMENNIKYYVGRRSGDLFYNSEARPQQRCQQVKKILTISILSSKSLSRPCGIIDNCFWINPIFHDI
jgi:hypothetical protein